MSSANIKFPDGKTITCSFDEDILVSELVSPFCVPMPCGGNHTCGKCKVKLSGQASLMTDEETALLASKEIYQGIRLSCMTFATGDCTIEISNQKTDGREVLLSANSCVVKNKGFSVAIDIGTTTIAMYLYKDSTLINAVGEQNEQARFGADVITRIGFNDHNILNQTIVGQLSQMLKKCITSFAFDKQIEKIVVTGNTTMLHFFFGLDPTGIAVSPFIPQSLFGFVKPANMFFLEYTNALVYLPPCISSYVGADLVCAMLASGMICDKTTLLADIGTNGEMALYHNDKLYTCSTAAGPALEGASIKMGMIAKNGAIDKVFLNEKGNLDVHVIGETTPLGICGSGLIHLLAILIKIQLVDETGMIAGDNIKYNSLIGKDNEGHYIRIGNSGVIITQRDIRQIQLAKAAICAGILTLLNECGLMPADVDEFFICGGFGSFIDTTAAGIIGIIPNELSTKVNSLGNAAGMGACMLFDDCQRVIASDLKAMAVDLELSKNAFFMEQYIDQMGF